MKADESFRIPSYSQETIFSSLTVPYVKHYSFINPSTSNISENDKNPLFYFEKILDKKHNYLKAQLKRFNLNCNTTDYKCWNFVLSK